MEIVESIKSYLSILDSDSTEEEAIEKLVKSLDKLAALCHDIKFDPDDKDYPSPPDKDHQETMRRAGAKFPSLGYYNVAGDIGENIAECNIHVGDAISDIAEIADDLSEVLWYFESTSAENALFYLELGFRTHWGHHMRSLQLYLHDISWG